MRLLSLEAEGVFSLGHVSLQLDNRKLLLITGFSNDDKSGNGAGKSSLANHAIVWGLFGQTYDGIRGNAVVNRNCEKKHGRVVIEFEDINGYTCKVIRTRNPNSLKLITNEVNSGHRLEKETQAQINHLLGRDFSTFIHADLIGPGTERSFFRLSGAEQVSVIETLLPVNNLDDWAATAKARAKATQVRIAEVERQKQQIIGKSAAMKECMDALLEQRKAWDKGHAVNITRETEIMRTIETARARYDLDIVVLVHKVGEKWEEIYQSSGIESANLWKKKIELSKEIEYLVKINETDTCGVCRQTVASDLKETARGELGVCQALYSDYDARQIQIDAWLLDCGKIKELKATVQRHDDGLFRSQNNLDILNSENNPYDEASVVVSILHCGVELAALDVEITKRTAELHWLEFWAKGFATDLRTMMIEEICPFLELRINEYLKRLGNPQFKAIVSTVKSLKSGDIREKFNLDIKSDHGADCFDLLSVGEKQIVSFAASLAVADLATTQVAGRSNVLILDEPFMGLHKNNCDNIINFLNECDVETILLISNEDALKDLVSNRIHIVKTKGQSWVE